MVQYKVKRQNLTRKNLDGSITKDEEINVCNTLSSDEADSTFIHELIHGIDWAKKIGLTEKQTRKLEDGIFETFVLNKWKIVKS
jgi:hypothetical protein